jgi:predicted PurR-regulated permease PerM
MTPKIKTTLTRAGAVLALVLVLMWLMSSMASVTTMLMIALFLAYVLNPLVIRLTSCGLGRSVSAFMLLLLGLTLALTFLLVLVPAVLGEIARFARVAPRYMAGLQDILLLAAEKLNLEIPKDWQELTQMLVEPVRKVLPGVADFTARLFATLFKSTLHIISSLFYALMVPVIAYYLMVSFEDMKRSVEDLIPPYVRKTVLDKLREIDSVVAAFVRGQLTVACLLGVLYSAGFLLVGIDLALVLGLLCGMLAIIPYVGSLVALIVGPAMALAKFGDLTHAAALVGWIAAVQVLEGYVLTPRIVGHAIGLHPVVYILALIAAGNLFGFVGMLVAIPVTAVLKVLLKSGIQAYRNSSLYRDLSIEESK